MFLYKLRGIKFRSSFNGKEKLCTLAKGSEGSKLSLAVM